MSSTPGAHLSGLVRKWRAKIGDLSKFGGGGELTPR
jgi:hypothetical protein